MRKIYLLSVLIFIASFAFGQKSLQYNKQGIAPTQQEFLKITNQNNATKDVIWSDDFEDGDITDWTQYDEDGDDQMWTVFDNSVSGGTLVATSASWAGSALTPENWLVSPAIILPTGAVFVDYNAYAQDQAWPEEHYKLLVSTTGNAVADFTTILHEVTIGAGNNEETISLAAYAGQTIYLAWVHYDCTDMYRLNLDDISVYSSIVMDLAIDNVLSPSNASSCTLTATEDVTVNIANVGGLDATGFEVSYAIDGGTPVVETYAGTIASGASVEYTFTTKADLSGLAYYNMNFEVTIADDVTASNNTAELEVRNTDGELVVRAWTDGDGGQEWSLTNEASEIVAYHGAYQWTILEETSVCILDDDCYTFAFTGFDETGWVELVYNSATVAGGETPGNTTGGVTWFGIGSACASVDAALTMLTTPAYAQPGSIDITGQMQNVGADNITSFDLTYNIDGGTESAVYSVTGVDIASGATYDFTHDVAYNFDTEDTYTINVTIANVNADEDANVANNTASKSITVTTAQVQRMVVLEQFTTENCGYCPGVLGIIEAHLDVNPNFIIMSHHAGYGTDWLTIDENVAHEEFYNGSIFAPAGMFDRHYNGLDNDSDGNTDPGPVFWDGATYGTDMIDERSEIPAFVTVNINGTNVDGELTLTVSGDFLAEYSQTIGVSLWITEDGITTENQSGASGTWTHRFTTRDAISARLGDEIESVTGSGDSYSQEYTFTVDPSWDIDQLYLVAMVNNMDDADVNNREIQNAVQVKLSDLQEANSISNINTDINIYPNPAKDVLNIYNAENANISIFDIVGKLVISENNISATQSINISNLTKGTYFVTINRNNSVETQKIVISK